METSKTELIALFSIARENRTVYLSIMGISWFWFMGAVLLSQMPTYVKHVIHGNEYVVTFFLAIFTLSVAIGSMISDKLSDRNIELGIVPLGAIGLSIFLFDLGYIDYKGLSEQLTTLEQFVYTQTSLRNYRIIFDLSMIGLFGSFFIVPLYALMQARSRDENRSRVIAACNIYNAIFMVASSIFAIVLYKLGMLTEHIFIVIALINIGISVYIFALLPEFIMRFALWIMAKTIYRLRYSGRTNIPKRGPVLLVANHISYIDWFIITAACQRPVRFVMDHNIFKIPILRHIFRLGQCIPIAPAKEDPKCKEEAFKTISSALRAGDVVCIFPEGTISYDGNLSVFRKGFETVLAKDPVPLIPISLHGLWGSFFSRKSGKAMRSMPKPRKRIIHAQIGKPLPSSTTAERLAAIMKNMLLRDIRSLTKKRWFYRKRRKLSKVFRKKD